MLKSGILNGGTLISHILDHFDKFGINDYIVTVAIKITL